MKNIIFVVILSIFFVAPLFSGAAPDSKPIPNDPDVVHGVLDNGLSYFVRENDTPENRAELRLIIKAGSVMEDDDQRGLAHFVEHMLFNGTDKYPKNTLIEKLESFGMDFGSHLNAYTGFDKTVYQLSTKTDDKEQFSTAMEILKEWAFHATFDEAEIDKERLVVQEEWRARLGVNERFLDKTVALLYNNSRYAKRLPIGDMDIVMNADYETIKRFYRDWYRPDLMAIIAVGDFDSRDVVGMIKNLFGNQPNPQNPPHDPDRDIPPHDKTLIEILTDPEMTETYLTIHAKYEGTERKTWDDFRDSLTQRLFSIILNDRFEEISQRKDAPFLGASLYDHKIANLWAVNISADVSEDKVQDGLEAALMEARSIYESGPLDSEVERAKITLMKYLENAYEDRNESQSSDLTSYLVESFLNDWTYPSVKWMWSNARKTIKQISKHDIADRAQFILQEDNRIILIKGPEPSALTELTEQDLYQTIEKVNTARIQSWQDNIQMGNLVPNPPKPGKIVSRKTDTETDTVTLKLSNGATVIYKKTDFDKDEIVFSAFSPGGDSLVDDDRFLSAKIGLNLLNNNGRGEYSDIDLTKMLVDKTAWNRAFINSASEGMTGGSIKNDMETLFQLIYLTQSAPRRDDQVWEASMQQIEESIRNRDSSPETVFMDDVLSTIFDNHLRLRPLTMENIGQINQSDALEIFKERFGNAADFTYIFVGDFQPAILEGLIKKWLAPLPGSEEIEEWQDRGIRLTSGQKEVTVRAGQEPKSHVMQLWLGEYPIETPEDAYINGQNLGLLAYSMGPQLTQIIREEYSGVYTINFDLITDIGIKGTYMLYIEYSCDPQRVDEISQRVKEIVARWRTDMPDKKFAHDAIAKLKRAYEENQKENYWWRNKIQISVDTKIPLSTLLEYAKRYEQITPELLNETAVEYIDDGNYLQAVMLPKE